MGNSAGGITILYLMASPLISNELFKTAIITSSRPNLAKNLNLQVSKAIIKELNVKFKKNFI